MKKVIENFNKQFEYKPKIENEEKLNNFNKFIIVGMGGSNLVADLIKIRDPKINITSHRDYGLPCLTKEINDRLFIFNSYSGNTEETINSLEKAIESNLPIAIISTNGKIIEMAKKYSLPYICMPLTDIQPRSALGYNLCAILKIINRQDLLQEAWDLTSILKPLTLESQGQELAQEIKNYIPVIYSSSKNLGISYNWKIKLNETGKIPAFYNVIPEANHNEINAFEIKEYAEKFYFILLEDELDFAQNQKRMKVLEELYTKKGIKIKTIKLEKEDSFLKIFNSLILADWTAYYSAKIHNLDPEQVSMVEELKKLI